MSEVLHVHAGEMGCWNCWKIKIWVKLATFWWRWVRWDRSHSFSVRRRLQWCRTNCNRLFSSRFSTLHLLNWFRRFSRCLCFLMRDLRADSRFDIMRRSFRSSITDTTGGSGSAGSASSLSEPELEVTGLGERRWWESSSQGEKSAGKAENRFPRRGSEGGWVVSMITAAEWRGFLKLEAEEERRAKGRKSVAGLRYLLTTQWGQTL